MKNTKQAVSPQKFMGRSI